jgi:hypothetical protein
MDAQRVSLDLSDLPVDVLDLSGDGLTIESLTGSDIGDPSLCICPCSCACSGCSSSVLCSAT